MENTLDLRVVIKHLANGSLGKSLCIVCLMPHDDVYESIFTKVCKEDREYCIADILAALCNIQFSDSDTYNVCINCFMTASVAYKFYLQAKRSNEILNFYTEEILHNLDNINLPDELTTNTLCMTLPYIMLETSCYDYDLQGIGLNNLHLEKPIKVEKDEVYNETIKKEIEDEQIVVVVQDNGQRSFYKVVQDGVLELLSESEKKNYKNTLKKTVKLDGYEKPVKRRKKRSPMTHKSCSRCPVKYRFIAKLKEHMKVQHNVELYVCKVCKAITENELEYHNHLKMHSNIHQCAICNMVFKKRDTIINHLKWHEKMKNISQVEGAHICEVCGVILESEACLKEHYDSKHNKRFTCYYCGRMYKGEMSFEMHIKKHEDHIKRVERNSAEGRQSDASSPKPELKKKSQCPTCGRYFVDERALLWHQRLHNNERPFTCDVCGRGFVTVNRRNQHALCAHTAPARRCPLCPALFHLRSMVNTHVKKVHLTTHKRRNRVSKHQNAYWRTEPVPIQDLSVAIQNDILELQAAKNDEQDWEFILPDSSVAMEDLV